MHCVWSTHLEVSPFAQINKFKNLGEIVTISFKSINTKCAISTYPVATTVQRLRDDSEIAMN